MKKSRDVINNEEGIALIMALLIITIFSLLGLSLLGLTINNVKSSTIERNCQSSFYIAEAGTNEKLNDINQSIMNFYKSSTNYSQFFTDFENSSLFKPHVYQNFQRNFGHSPIANVTLTPQTEALSHSMTFNIISTGKLGICTKTVVLPIQVKWQDKQIVQLPTDKAVFTRQTIKLTGGATIEGSVATNSEGVSANKPAIILKGGSKITGDIWVGPNSNLNKAVSASKGIHYHTPKTLLTTQTLQLPPFPSYPNLTLHPNAQIGTQSWNTYEVINNGNVNVDSDLSNGYTLVLDKNYAFHDINLNSNYTLYIDTGSQDRQMVVDNLNLKTGHIILKGSGKLTLYVKGDINLDGGSTINNFPYQTGGPTDRLNVYMDGENSIKLSGSQMIYGSLYAQNANIDITGGGGFQGNILTGGSLFKVSGGGNVNSQLILAPNADVKLTGGGKINGVIISKSLDASGGTLVQQPIDTSHIPYFPSDSSDVSVNQLVIPGVLKEIKSQ